MEPWAKTLSEAQGLGIVAPADRRRWFDADIARAKPSGKAMSKHFVNALCDRIQPIP
jgi:hypothetical protein